MYGTLAGALAGRKVPFDRATYTATVDGRIVGVARPSGSSPSSCTTGSVFPAEAPEATERALAVHPQGCPAHESVKDAITVTWDATVTIGDDTVVLKSEPAAA